MSIIALSKVTVYGHIADKPQVLEDLQDMGCLHLLSLNPDYEVGRRGGPSSEAREALQFLLSCPRRRKQMVLTRDFDPVVVEQEALILKRQIKALEDERDFLTGRIAAVKPWGDFHLPPREDLVLLRLWFYLIPHYLMKELEHEEKEQELADNRMWWEVVKEDHRFKYVVLVSRHQPAPEVMPVPRERLGSKPLSWLEQRLEEVEIALEDLQAERESMTKWCALYARNLHQLEDRAARNEAAQHTHDDAPLFALQAWAPAHERDDLTAYAEGQGIAIDIQEPTPDDDPPTLMENASPSARSGQDLVSFYMTPGYRLWDPSSVVFFSFVVFFAMILSDVGYGLLLGGVLGLYWKRLGASDGGRRFRLLLSWMVGASVVWGAMIGSYFGIAMPDTAALMSVKILDINDYGTMMLISILLGVTHLVIANVADAWCKRQSEEQFASYGWVAVLVGGFLAWLNTMLPPGLGGPVKLLGILSMLGGGGAILWFTKPDDVWWKRVAGGLLGFTKISAAFGDTLSYLRLFALGLAGASLSVTFNDLAGKIDDAVPGIGMLFAIIILLFGHSLNLILSISSGFIHGLRLNFIEFFNWSVPEEGYLFRAFARKEKLTWKD